MLPIAPSTYFLHHARQVNPPPRPARAKRDDDLRIAIQRVWDANWQAYGPRKVWQQLGREDVDVARCMVERLMGAMGLAGAVRGRAWVTTPAAATAGVRPPALVDRQFTSPRPRTAPVGGSISSANNATSLPNDSSCSNSSPAAATSPCRASASTPQKLQIPNAASPPVSPSSSPR